MLELERDAATTTNISTQEGLFEILITQYAPFSRKGSPSFSIWIQTTPLNGEENIDEAFLKKPRSQRLKEAAGTWNRYKGKYLSANKLRTRLEHLQAGPLVLLLEYLILVCTSLVYCNT